MLPGIWVKSLNISCHVIVYYNRFNEFIFQMQTYCGGKLLKKFSEPDEFETQIGNILLELETSSDLKDIRGLSIVAAKEIEHGDKKVSFDIVYMSNCF